MRQFIAISMLLFLSACGLTGGEMLVGAAGVAAGHVAAEEGINPVPPKGQRTAEGYANQLRDNVKKTGQKVQEWWFTPLPSTDPLPVQASYCYKSQTDTLCYRQPMPGWEHRLIAWQGTNAEPPPPAVMQLMPRRNLDASKLPESRMAGAQPVFVEPLPETKEVPKDSAEQPAAPGADKANEALPDPATSPQL